MSAFASRALQLGLAATALAVDRVTKHLIERFFAGGVSAHPYGPPSVAILGDAVRFTYVRNRGVVFGILAQATFPYRDELLLGLSGLAILVLIAYLWRTSPARRAVSCGLALVLGGAAGNLIDRVSHGYVVDFIDVSLYFTRWHVFNVADTAIVLGVGLMAYDLLRQPDPAGPQAAARPPDLSDRSR